MKQTPPRNPHRSNLQPGLWPMVFALVCALTATAHATDRDYTLRFLPSSSSDVLGYRAYVTDQTSQIQDVFDLSLVVPDPDGVARVAMLLDTEHSFVIGVTAYNADAESELSNLIQVSSTAVTCDPTLCDDNLPCTIDSCDPAGCLNTPLPDGASCDDGYVDTVADQCVASVCQGTALVCRDDFDCDDGDICNGLETCGGTECFQDTPLDCGAPTACTTPYCDPQSGCGMASAADGTPCDDGIPATIGDVCLAGACQGGGQAPRLAVDSVTPNTVGPGTHTLTIRGRGFELGAKLRFSNGAGRRPRVRSLRLVDGQTLEAEVKITARRRHRVGRFWDVTVRLPDETEAQLLDGLRVDP